MFLSGQRDPDLIILDNLNDKDLLSVCITNRYANHLCNNEDFWRIRFIKKWGKKICVLILRKLGKNFIYQSSNI